MTGNDASKDLPGAPEALGRVKPALSALDPQKITTFRGNIPIAVANIFRVRAAYAEDKTLFAAILMAAGIPADSFDDLEDRAKALWQSDLLLRQAMDPEDEVTPLVVEGTVLRRRLFRVATYLWEHDPIIAPTLDEIRAGSGYMDLADDLQALPLLFSGHWDSASSEVRLDAAEIERAKQIGFALASALGRRADGEDLSELRDQRNRAAVYADEALDTLRAVAGVVFLNDAEGRRPYVTLHNRPQRRRARGDAESHDDVNPAPTPTPEDNATSVDG